jgi:hypothetical protein
MKNFLRVYELEKFDKHNREENILLVNQWSVLISLHHDWN